MGLVGNSMKAGFGGTLGSLGAMSVFGILVVVGIWLVMSSKADPQQGKERNNLRLGLGVALIIIGSLPFAPLLGLDALSGVLSGNTNN